MSIVTTKSGFKIQEIYSVRKINVPPDDDEVPYIPKSLLNNKNQHGEIFPDKGMDYVIKAQATVNVSFSASSSGTQPRITVESNSISYGNRAVEKVFDKRNFGQIIVDFLKRVLGLNQIQELPSGQMKKIAPQKTDQENSDEGHRCEP